MAIKDDLKQKWDGMDPKQRTNTVRMLILIGAVVLVLLAYFGTGQHKKIAVAPKKVNVIDVGENRLEDDVRASVQKQREVEQDDQKENAKRLSEQDKLLDAQQAQMNKVLDALKKADMVDGKGKVPDAVKTANGPAPQWPSQWAGSAPAGRHGATGAPPAEPAPEMIGDIGSAAPEAGKKDDKKKANKKYFLPVSFMPAKLLTGLKAKTIETARNDPEPMLLRVQAPAILPNEVRAQLKGCLVVADGFGSLASERIETRLVSLSCYDYDDHAVIEANIKGIVVDKDGVKGLAGHVVSKAGANMARAVLAGAFQGAGEALTSSSTTSSVSPLGQTNTIDPTKVGRTALGTGLSSGANEMAKVYLDLVRQSAPVVEHGPDTDCSVVLTEGVWLELKDSEEN